MPQTEHRPAVQSRLQVASIVCSRSKARGGTTPTPGKKQRRDDESERGSDNAGGEDGAQRHN